MHTIKFFAIPVVIITIWVAVAAGTLASIGSFAAATSKSPAQLKVVPASQPMVKALVSAR